MKYISVKNAADKWVVTERMACAYCDGGRVKGACREGNTWMIPENAEKPKRKKSEPTNMPTPPKFLAKLIKQRTSTNFSGLYDYTQVNMAYSNCRLASNRMTREQVGTLYKTDKIASLNEPLKVNDIIEIRNQFRCLDYVLDHAMQPLTQTMIQKLHVLILADGWCHKRRMTASGIYRKDAVRTELGSLLKSYEAKKNVGLYEILDFHVRFERIRPFDDCNGRVGRMILFKECLRHGITPFILDDKRRTGYLKGIRQWDEDPDILTEVCAAAQARFSTQIDLQELIKHNSEYTRRHLSCRN